LGPCLSSHVGGHPLRPPTRLRLGRLLPCQLADGPQAPPEAPQPFLTRPLTQVSLWGISHRFQQLSPSSGQVTYVLLTRAPLSSAPPKSRRFPFDLHVLGTPPAFILSQDQTLRRVLLNLRFLEGCVPYASFALALFFLAGSLCTLHVTSSVTSAIVKVQGNQPR
jgi:hypothetical protein